MQNPENKLILLGMRRIFLYFLFCFQIFLLFIITTNAIIYIATQSYIYSDISKIPTAQAALIPGAGILINGGLSPVLKDRADFAIELYKAEKVSKILASGDNSTETYNEVNPIRTYLLTQGIPDEDIFLDHAGFDTYSTMYRARDVFGVTSVIISTQKFHLPRSVFIARSLGINAYGINADVGHLLFHNYAREVFANEKALYNLIMHRKPKYLGDPIPIMGDGRNYP